MNVFKDKISPFLYLGFIYLVISFLLRVVFVFHPITTAQFSIVELFSMFGVGILNDLFVFTLASSVFALYFLFLSNGKYQSPFGYIIFGILVLFLLYTVFAPNNIFKQYGGSFPEIAMAFVGLKTLLFGLMLFLPNQRQKIRNSLYFITVFLYVLIIVFNAVSEYFFWNEFGLRYNFIAVDYLIYTNEVIGNIMESYPVVPLFTVIFLVTLGLSWWVFRVTKTSLVHLPTIFQKGILLLVFVGMCFISVFSLGQLFKIKSNNIFVTEIQSNGLPKFYDAFVHKELDYFAFYPTMEQSKAESLFLDQFQPNSLYRKIISGKKDELKNVVLISVESLSADFMEHYGNPNKVTPFLDSLASKSLLFTNLYATGNRTVRGLEALTLCIPPTAGESIVKRVDNKNKFTTGSVFKAKGYQVKYLYGGYSYFDNMKDFFEGNGYDIVDRDQFQPNEISFANVWGVCDEDMAKKAINVMNEEAKTGKPFFNHWMTVSNHRPFTYPEGKIDIPGNAMSREGGVKYTDYSLRRFFAMAKKQSWYKNTVFVIVSDHCASSAGKTELPLDKYRIPGMVFSEGFIAPKENHVLMSQIDVMPTVFGLLNFSYESKFLGQDVLQPQYSPRAYIATYQDLGLIKDNFLTVISPTKKIKQYTLSLQPSQLPPAFQLMYNETLVKTPREEVVQQTIAAYQSTSFWVQRKMLNKK